MEEDPSKRFAFSLITGFWNGTGVRYWMINGSHTLHPTVQDQEKCMATSKHMEDNPARVIISGCNTAVEHLSCFAVKVLYGIASELPSRIKDTNHMLDIIVDLNNSNLYPELVLVSFWCVVLILR